MLRRRTPGTGCLGSRRVPSHGLAFGARLVGTAAIALLAAAGIALAASAGEALEIAGHTFEYLGVSYNSDGTSTWTYRATSGTKPSLAYWVLELDSGIFSKDNIVRCSEGREVKTDHNTGLYGLKFGSGYKDGEAREVSFTLDHWYRETPVRIGTKTANDVEIGGPIIGPGGAMETPNAPPVAADDRATVNEDESVSIAVLANDSDADGALVRGTVTIARGPSHGTATPQPASGDVTYVPASGFCGEDELTYTVEDDDGAPSSEARVVVSVVCNIAPRAEEDVATTDESTSVVIPILSNDSDADGLLAPTTVVVVQPPSLGSLNVHPGTGVATYTPYIGSCGEDAFEYTVRDDDGATSNVGRVTVSILCSDPPLAIDDLYNAAEGGALEIPAVGVLANDKETPGRALTAKLVSATRHGALTLSEDGGFSYSHDGSETVEDAFTYVASDGRKESNAATVRLAIAPTNDAPVAADDWGSTDEDTQVEVSVLANDSDPDGDTLSVDWAGPAEHGRVTNFGARVGYSPDPNYYGSDAFSYGVSDGRGGTATAVVHVTIASVNDLPVVQADSATTDEDASIVLLVLANDRDPDGDALWIASVTQPGRGTATTDGEVVTYTPDANFNGVDTFSYAASDGMGGVASAIVTIAVAPVNDAPQAMGGIASTLEDTPVTIDAASGNVDPDGDPLTVVGVSSPAHGAAALDGGLITYTPDAGFHGGDEFTYTISDGNGGTSTGRFIVTVAPVNHTPIAQDDSATTNAGATVTIAVLANDRDPDGDALTLTSVEAAENGGVEIAGDAIVYSPDPGFDGVDGFRYSVADGRGGTASAGVTVGVAVANRAPVAVGETVVVDENASATIALLANDSDPDGDPLAIESVSEPQNGRLERDGAVVVYTPGRGFHGVDLFTYTVSDGRGGVATASVALTVLEINEAPIARDDAGVTDEDTSVALAVLVNDEDPDGDALAVESVSPPAHGVATVDGAQVVYVPAPNYGGEDEFRYVVRDEHGATSSALVRVHVDAINDAPIAGDDTAMTLEDVPLAIPVLTNDVDADGDTLSIESLSQPLHGAATVVGGGILYTPSADYYGADQFTYVAADGRGGSALATVTVTVASVNDFPTAGNDEAVTPEDVSVSVLVLANDRDADGDALVVQAVTQPAHGVATNLRDHVVYEPSSGWSGTDTFGYTVSDGRGGSATGQVSITVMPTNHNPVAQDDSATTSGEMVQIQVLANDRDSDGDFLIVQATADPEHGVVMNGRTGISYIPNTGFHGVDSFSYVVSDGNGGTATASVVVAVAEPNGAPVARGDSGVTTQGTPIVLDVLLNDTDPEGDVLHVESVTQPRGGRTTHDDRTIAYEPGFGTNGGDVFEYTVSDGRGGTATATVMIAVVAVDRPPTAQDDSITTDRNTAVTIPVLENDSDDGEELTIVSADGALHGVVAVQGSTIVYAPNADFVGTDEFRYTVRDTGGNTSTASVTVGVAETAGGGGAAESLGCEGKVVINEVAWAGSAASTADEWIELRNLGTSAVDVTGWTVQWRRTRPEAPEDELWKVVELRGTITPAEASACDSGADTGMANVGVSAQDPNGLVWDITYPASGSVPGYFLLERTREEAVGDMAADLLYDLAGSPAYALSDQGEVILLVNARGEIVDTANASNMGRDGWAAGNARTFGSMERVNPLGPDEVGNWLTNLGVVARGRDAANHPLRATPAAPNSPSAEVLYQEIGAGPIQVKAGAPLAVIFDLTRDARRAAGWPWIVTTRPNFSAANGIGQTWACSFSGRATAGDTRYELEIETREAPPGVYLFWISYGYGKSLLLPVLLTS